MNATLPELVLIDTRRRDWLAEAREIEALNARIVIGAVLIGLALGWALVEAFKAWFGLR